MKPIKMLGLAMVAALATMALLGAASASAETVKLCKANESPCGAGNAYPVPQAIKSALKSEQADLSTKTESLVISCQESSVSGETTEEKGAQLIGTIKTATWGNCRGPLNETCTATALQLPWTSHVTQAETQGNGYLYAGSGGTGQPGALIKCKTILGTIECEYKSKEAQPEHEGEWTKLSITGGKPATINAAEVQLKKTKGGSICGTEGLWKAEYSVTEPGEGWVSHTEP